MNQVNVSQTPALRFGRGPVSARDLTVAMRELGYVAVSGGGRHSLHYVRGKHSIPCSAGGRNSEIGPPLLGCIAREMGVRLSDFTAFIANPKRHPLSLDLVA